MAFALIFLLSSPARAQQFDLSAGISTVTGPESTPTLQTVGGGAYPTFGLDFLFYHNLGVGFNAAFRASENLYQGQLPFRPFFYDVDAVYAPPLGKRAQLELSAGIGAESVRFYTPTFQCVYRLYQFREQQSLSRAIWRGDPAVRHSENFHPARSAFVLSA